MGTTGVKVCIGVSHCHYFESSYACKTFIPEERIFKGFCAHALELCKNVQRCLWNQFVLRNLANSAVGQTRIGLWSYSMNKAEWEEL